MKKILLLVVATTILISCSKGKEQSTKDVIATQDLEQIRKRKKLLDKKQEELSVEIKLLTNEISKLDTNKKVPLITTLSVKEEPFVHYLELQGNVKTRENILVYPEVSGQIVKIYVKEGQRVYKGQTLAKIDAGGLENQLQQAQVALNLAKTTYERQKRLWSQKIGSEIQFLQTKTNYESQINSVGNLKKTLAKFTIKAPITGVIDDIFKEQGTLVAPSQGGEIFRIINLTNMYIETDVPEGYITSINKGKSVEVNFPVLGKKISSKIRQAGSFINPANRTFKIEIGVPNKDRSIKPNLTVRLKINDYTNPNAILIPQSIISENANGEQYVYVIEKKEGKLITKQVIIKTGKVQGDVVEIIEGLVKGDNIVMEGARTVINGQEVKVLK